MSEHETPEFRAGRVLAETDTWADPPDVFDQVMADTSARPSKRPLVWAAAAVVALAVGFAGVRAAQPAPVDFVIAGTDLAPGAQAAVRLVETPAGLVYRLDVTGLDPAGSGAYYEGWVVSDSDWVSVGTFHMRGGDGSVTLWSGVDPAEYPRLVITLQQEGEGAAQSGLVVMDGHD